MSPERQNRIETVLLNRQPGLTVVMENVNDPHNISAVMRTCDAVGIQDIYVLNTVIAKHEYFGPKSSSSAAKWLTIHEYDNAETCFKTLRSRYKTIYTTHLCADSISVFDINFQDDIALVFGNEHDGVTEATRKLSDGNFIIPQVGMIQSLNISVACAISIYEAFRQKNNAGHYHGLGKPHPSLDTLNRKWTIKPPVRTKWRKH
ncbi:MAG: RNA methyltransferase [Sphingobacteriia bacterium]|nr:MAG: RNA methyltransferase [Sphingobacteriia bacterium]TAG31196.1 MAG: RNA methyltransferase [Sphingobacteriia bacterium]TAH07467.1 MAG: RNA methyltransferase [Sphingobacteriia bacterium]